MEYSPASQRDRSITDALDGKSKPEVLVLSSSLFVDRVFLYTRFFNQLSSEVSARVWATSARNPHFRDAWNDPPALIEEFPEVFPFKEFPYNYLRRLNEFAWDFRQRPPSRMSMMRHIWNRTQKAPVRALKLPARALALLKVERHLEDRLERLLLNYQRSPEALRRLRSNRPAVVVTTGPFQFEQPAVVAVAKNLGIPTLALIPSWDNISTKNRLMFRYDGYLVWSAQAKRELHEFYPQTRNVPVYVVGAPQFDLFFQDRFKLSRAEFCAAQGLKPDLPIIVYAISSPNVFSEYHGALYLAEKVARGELGDVQMIIRPNPIHDFEEVAELIRKFSPRVIMQQTSESGLALTARTQNERQIIEWVNTFRHADVVVNLSSTVAIDAAIFDRPVVNLDYDPEPGQPKQELVKDINHCWTHFKPIAESGGVWMVNNREEMVEAVKTYLAHPELHREKRRWIAEYVCGHLDGRCADRMAHAIIDFANNHAKRSKRI
ncbi:MAG TPA: hypothetical protein VIF64_13695 [Pyrinomonadaceae bacterium]